MHQKMQVTGQIVVCPQEDRSFDGLWDMGGIPEQPLLSGPVLHPMDLLIISFPRHQLLQRKAGTVISSSQQNQ